MTNRSANKNRHRYQSAFALMASLVFTFLTKEPFVRAAPPATPGAQSSLDSPMDAKFLTDNDWRNVPRVATSPRQIDKLIAAASSEGGKSSSPPPRTTDEQFLRRVSLDLAGTLPSPADISAFLTDADPAKRTKKIDALLSSDAYARHWARFWRDVVTARITNRRSMGLTRSFEEWLFERFRAGDDWRSITRSILTAEGELRFTLNTPSPDNGALFFLVAHDGAEAEERAAETSRVFMGIQIQCAQCHDHPSEAWKRTQFHEFAAYFARIKFEQLFDAKKLAGVQLITLKDSEHKVPSLTNPDQFSLAHPRFLDGRAPGTKLSDLERRQALANSIVADENYWFAVAHVNRIWNALMGSSFYPHVDDLGTMKPVQMSDVLKALVGSFQASGYDTRALIRTIGNTEAYQQHVRNADSSANREPFVSSSTKRLRADTLWDSLVHVLGKIEHGARFHTGSGVRFNTSFLEGKFRAEFDFDPSLDSEEVNGTIPQALFLMNNPILNKLLAATKTNALGRMLRDHPQDGDAVANLYLLVLARQPTDRERSRCEAYIAAAPSRLEAFEDLLWALINSTEFQRTR